MPQFVPQFALEDLAERVARQLIPISSRSGSLNVAMPSFLRYATISSSVTAASGQGTTTAQALLDKLQIADPIYAPR